MRPSAVAFVFALSLLVACALAGDVQAAEIDLLEDGLGVADCLDPNATVPGGFPAAVVCNRRVYGLADEFQGVGLNVLTRGGAFNPSLRVNLLSAARPQLGEARFQELLGQLGDGEFLTAGQLGTYRALRSVGDDGAANAMVAGSFDDPNTIRELLGALAPRDRLRDLLSPAFPDLLTRDPNDFVPHFAAGLATNVVGLTNVPEGLPKEQVKKGVVPFLVGRDGIRNTADDLPFFDPNRGMRIVPPGFWDNPRPLFRENDFRDVVVVDVDSTAFQFFGRLRRESDPIAGWRGRVEIGCDNAGGEFHFDPNGPDTCTDAMGGDITEEVFRSSCKDGTGNFSDGGINADGDCIRLGVFWPQVPFAALQVLGDLSLRPEGAELEPVDLTDFKLIARGDGKGLPARARSPLGTLVFPSTDPNVFARRVDSVTGAPVNATGELICLYRDGNGDPTADPSQSVGPNGVQGDADDTIPSVGNCLLWENPDSAGAQQFLRDPGAIASSHPAHQTFFHTLCTLSFDPDNGFCTLDQLNAPGSFSVFSNIVAGGFFGSLATSGLRWLRTTVAPFDGEIPPVEIENTMFAQIPGTDLSNLSPEKKALLGCGPGFLSPCGAHDVMVYTNALGDDASIEGVLEGRTADTIGGGPDLINADADFLTQEFSTRKVLSTDGFVEPLPWETDPNWLAQGVVLHQAANQNDLDPRCHEYPEGDFRRPFFDPTDPVCFDDQGSQRIRTYNDPTDATNPLNAFRETLGESCIQSFGDTARFLTGDRAAAFDTGCTDLETVSANFERYWIALDILGHDDVPDPPESLEELWKMLDGDPNNDATGDPLSGPDGIFVANLATGLGNGALADANAAPRFEPWEKDAHLVRLEAPPQSRPGLVHLDRGDCMDLCLFVTPDGLVPIPIPEASQRFMREYDPTTCPEERCHLIIVEDTQLTQVEFNEVIATGERKWLVTVLPVALAVSFGFGSDPNGNLDFNVLAPSHINYLKLYYQDPAAAMNLLDEEFEGGPAIFPSLVPVVIDGEQFFISSAGLRELFLKEPGQPATTCQDLDANGICDFDQDDDGVYDGADDYTPGPVSDDRILCGSSLPGDILHDAIQFELARPSDESAFDTAFPDGLPPRSPVFCGSPQELLGMTGETAPGQRTFIWHGAGRPDDPDADAWPDLVDICPFFPNPAQDGNSDGDLLCDDEDPCKFHTNTLPLVISGFSGIPDECLCGDFDGDGFHSTTDAAAINNCAAFISFDCVPERDEVAEPFDGFYSATDADLVNRVAAFIDPAYTLTCPRRPEGTCGGLTGVSCSF
jgi:hypothetical protein